MILVEHIISPLPQGNRVIDVLNLEWFETGKRVLRRKTVAGKELAFRFLREAPSLQQGDILWMDEQTVITVNILPAAAIVLKPSTMADMAAICYEIGNKHLPLFLEQEEVLIPFEEPLYKWLEARGYHPSKEDRVLNNMLRSNVVPHEHATSTSLFSKIMQLTSR
jgi:urease accessory protein